jgi:hypothetical protein
MRARYKRWKLLAALAAILLFAFLTLSHGPRATTSAVAITFVGYTNPPDSDLRFVLFSVSNRAPFAVRWHGSWVEIEGDPGPKAETINRSLPGFTRQPTLKAGAALSLAIGEPLYDSETARWRFAMSFTRYTWRERWFEFSVRHKLPLRLGSLVLVDTERIFNPSNNVTVATAWLKK